MFILLVLLTMIDPTYGDHFRSSTLVTTNFESLLAWFEIKEMCVN